MPSRISDSFRAHSQKHLDLNSIKELPESHAWTSSNDYPSENSCNFESIPVIDLDNYINNNNINVLEHIGQACKKWGAFQIINHNISERLLQDIELAGKSLFSLPMQQKLKAARSPEGVTGYGVARISSFFSKLMWSEGFTIVGSPLEHARQIWPHDYQKFCDVIEEYEREMEKLAGRLMWLMLGSLGITKEEVKWAVCPKGESKGGSAALQLNSYPACPDPDRAMGLAAHTDSTILTILHQNNTSGLQVFKEGSGWVTVPPFPGALVVNVGDLLHILSNGLYPSVLHRAVVNRTRHRLSVAYLYGPPSRVKVSPLAKLVDQRHPPLYRAVTWSEYLGTKARHFDKALSSVRLCAPLSGFTDAKDHNGVQVG
ncbi:gibberellin 3-beta-dioxygenase 1-like [Nicotiana tabacum]|uniref:gibberellin 3beta-dioxygenase n=1 Tax=Nicotiana tabacum TaxID=4097 RepID=Q9SLQ9_TOBAC|nr:gibberellin 3-beta-dioxygenase 1-like [Nicotiana tabacum]BAA89316.1 gibberellin 3beta-hydroxylase [Nicotiana tabacum]